MQSIYHFKDRVSSLDILKELEVESLLVGTERSQLRVSGNPIMMSPGCFTLEVFQGIPTRKRLVTLNLIM